MTAKTVVVDYIASLTLILAVHGGTDVELRFPSARVRLSGVAPAYLDLLQRLHAASRPVFVELDDAGRLIRLLIPYIAKIARLDGKPDGGFDVMLDPSAVVHTLDAANPNFKTLRDALAAHSGTGRWLLVTETDAHEIIDVRPVPGGREPRAKHVSPRVGPASTGGVTLAKAAALFAQAQSCTCEPKTAPAPCIPFLYPDDGCFARAHEMCRLMVAQGVEPRKIWLHGGIKVQTRNNPRCSLFWFYHVAPTLDVAAPGGTTTAYVLDPSLFGEPVPEQTWLSVMDCQTPTIERTPWTQYQLTGATDDDFEGTNQDLAFFREQLVLRSLGPDGPPPYAKCG